MCGGTGLVAGILEMSQKEGTGRSVSTRALETSISVSENLQKNLGGTNYQIGRIRRMQEIQPSSPGTDGMIYVNSPTWDSWRVSR